MKNIIMNKLGICTIGMKKEIAPEAVQDIKDSARIDYRGSTIVIGHTLILLHGKTNKLVYKIDRAIKSIKAHFDNEYTIREWSVDEDGSYNAVKQLFRYDVAEDMDSRSEFVIVWTRLDKDMLHTYIDGLFYGCSCSYDCCGHWFTNLWTHKTKKFGPLAIVFLGHGRNV